MEWGDRKVKLPHWQATIKTIAAFERLAEEKGISKSALIEIAMKSLLEKENNSNIQTESMIG